LRIRATNCSALFSTFQDGEIMKNRVRCHRNARPHRTTSACVKLTIIGVGTLLGAASATGIGPATAGASVSSPVGYHWGMADLGRVPVTGPTPIGYLPPSVVALTTGFDGSGNGQFNLAQDASGTVYSWGQNYNGVLGNGTTVDNDTPAPIPGLPAVTTIAAGGTWAAAVDTTGHLWTWGQGSQGQMADGTFNNYSAPHEVPGLTGVVGVAAGGGAGVANLSNGSVVTWGRNTFGGLGTGSTQTNSAVPVHVPNLTNVVQVSHSWQTDGAVDSSGRVWIWGFTGCGSRGDGTSPNQTSVPVQVPLPGPAVSVSVGGNYFGNGHVLAVLADGSLWAWGCDAAGQVGNGALVAVVPAPVQVPIGGPVLQAIAGGDYSVAVTARRVYEWGGNEWGQLGNGTTINSDLPVRFGIPVTVIGGGEASIDAMM
jgi:alpha-tubulin suppressor-like RCC1 family protein